MPTQGTAQSSVLPGQGPSLPLSPPGHADPAAPGAARGPCSPAWPRAPVPPQPQPGGGPSWGHTGRGGHRHWNSFLFSHHPGQVRGNTWSVRGAEPSREPPVGSRGSRPRAAAAAGSARCRRSCSSRFSGVVTHRPMEGRVFGLSVCRTRVALSLARPDLRAVTPEQPWGLLLIPPTRSFPLGCQHPQRCQEGNLPPAENHPLVS